MSTRSRVPFVIKSRLAFDHADPVEPITMLADKTLGEYDGQFYILDPGGSNRILTLWNDSSDDSNGAKAPRGLILRVKNISDGGESISVRPVIGTTQIDLSTNPTATNTITIGGLVFEFLAAAATVASDAYIGVLRASTAAATLENLVNAINGDVVSDTGILLSTAAPALKNNTTIPVRADKVGTKLVLHYASGPGGCPTSGASLDLSTNPTATNTVTIGADVYEFLASGATVATPGNIGVIRAGSAAATLANFIAAINGLTTTPNGILDAGVQAAMVGTEKVYAATYAGSLLWIWEADSAGGNAAATKTSLALADALTAAVNWSVANCNVGPAIAVSDTLAATGIAFSHASLIATETICTIGQGQTVDLMCTGASWEVMGGDVASVDYHPAADSASATGNTKAVYDKSVTIPADTLKPGSVIEVDWKVTRTGQNSTDTLANEIVLGPSPWVDGTDVVLCASAAANMAADRVFVGHLTAIVKDNGTSLDVVSFYHALNVVGTALIGGEADGLAVDPTIDNVLAVTHVASSTSAGNTSKLEMLHVKVTP